MKKLLFLLTILCITSCSSREFLKTEVIDTKCYIDNVSVCKYSKVEGHIYYKGISLGVDNGNEGYYYKHYSLKPGDVINVKIHIDQYVVPDMYKYNITLETRAIDVSNYEISNR